MLALAEILTHFPPARRVGPNQYRTICPVHGGGSLVITNGDTHVLFKCWSQHCPLDALLAAAGLTHDDVSPARVRASLDLLATHDYRDAAGVLRYQVVQLRTPPGAKKQFKQRRPTSNGGQPWTWNLKGVTRLPFRLPELAGHARLFVCEGEKDVNRLWSLGLPATCNSGGAGKWDAVESAALVAAGVRECVLLQDDDPPGAAHVAAGARHLADAGIATVTVPPFFHAGDGGDVSDWLDAGHTVAELEALAGACDPSACPRCGSEMCTGCEPPDLDTPPPDADEVPRPTLRVLSADEAMQTAPPTEIVESVAWAGCITVLVAESGGGKTFIALDLAAAVSAGLSWHGRSLTPGSVVHIGYEGDAIGLRLRALREHRQARLEHVYHIRADAPLSPVVTREGEQRSAGEHDVRQALTTLAAELAQSGRPPIVLVMIDTVRASLTGSEDSSESVSAYLRAIRRVLAAVPTAAALLIHHAGWQDGESTKKRERGSSAFRGNVDATLYLEAGTYDPSTQSAPLTLTTQKVRDGERPAPLRCRRQRVTFPERDRHGKPVTSCVIDPDMRSDGDVQAERQRTTDAAEHAFDRRMLQVLRTHPDGLTSFERFRVALHANKEAVNASVSRLVLAGLMAPPDKQRAPYTLTAAGLTALVNGSGEATRSSRE
jgi:hypothetical protein